MAVANLHETLLSYTLRKNELTQQIMEWQSQKTLVMREQGDVQSLANARKSELRKDYKKLFEESPELQEKYADFTEIPEFEEQMEIIEAELRAQVEELSIWETELDAQITTASTELEEINAYIDSFSSMLSSNLQEDFDYSLG